MRIGAADLNGFTETIEPSWIRAILNPAIIPLTVFDHFALSLPRSDHSTKPLRRSMLHGEIFVTASSILLAVIAFFHERRLGRRGHFWAIYVFLLGLPGLFGYWHCQDAPTIVACRKCNHQHAQLQQRYTACGTDLLNAPQQHAVIILA